MPPCFIIPVDTSEGVDLFFFPAGFMRGEILSWHVFTWKLAWNSKNGLFHFGHLSPSLSYVSQGIRLALCLLAPGGAEGPTGLAGMSYSTVDTNGVILPQRAD